LRDGANTLGRSLLATDIVTGPAKTGGGAAFEKTEAEE
jgi:hypothetical protein